MRFLADENIPVDVATLRNEGHDVAWIRTDAPGSKDPDILKRAVADNRVLLTFDKDFGDLAFQYGLPANCGIVLFRLPASSSASVAIVVAAAIRSRTDLAGHFSVADPARIRVRSLPAPHVS